MTQHTVPPQLHTGHKLFGLDHLRALAITIVFIYHYSGIFGHPEWVRSVGEFGWTGVDLFFVLSGYLISSQLFAGIAQDNRVPFKTFFTKRFFRIIPPYLVVVALYFLFPALHEREALAPLWKYLTFTQNLGLDLRYQGTFSHAWSLCIEEQFYLFLPLILIALVYCKAMKRGLLLLLLFFALGFAARLYSWYALVQPFEESDSSVIYWYKWIYYPTYCRLDGLLTGVAIAAAFRFRPRLKQKIQQYSNALLVAGGLILTGAYFLCEEPTAFAASIFGYPLIALGYGCWVAAAVSPTCILYKFRSAITARLATLSYAIYLTHKIIIHVTQEQFAKFGIEKDSNLMLLICIITSVLGAFILNSIVEKPFQRLRNRVLRTN